MNCLCPDFQALTSGGARVEHPRADAPWPFSGVCARTALVLSGKRHEPEGRR